MRDTVETSGVILQSQPIGEYDKRLVILTRERGKITAFARGARRPKSTLIALTNPFVFAKFWLYEGRDSYTVSHAEAVDYFTDLPSKMPGILYGYYFLELASYYGREGIPAEDTVNLIFTALRAIEKSQLPLDLIRSIYEERTLVINGDYAPPSDPDAMDRGASFALRYAASAPFSKLFTFTLTPESEAAFTREIRSAMKRTVDRRFKTLAVIDEMS